MCGTAYNNPTETVEEEEEEKEEDKEEGVTNNKLNNKINKALNKKLKNHKSFKQNCEEVKAFKAEVVKAYWQNKKIEVHVMSKTPSRWVSEVVSHVDVIYIHPSIDENIEEVLKEIKQNRCDPGIALSIYESIEPIQKYIDQGLVKNVLLLAIPKPGFSGQKFDLKALNILDELNKNKKRNSFKICVDGGVDDKTIKLLNVESVVSGSFVLNAKDPVQNIMYLQTSGEYAEY